MTESRDFAAKTHGLTNGALANYGSSGYHALWACKCGATFSGHGETGEDASKDASTQYDAHRAPVA